MDPDSGGVVKASLRLWAAGEDGYSSDADRETAKKLDWQITPKLAEEIESQLPNRWQVEAFLRRMMYLPVLYAQVKDARQARRDLNDVDNDIEKAAERLADLIESRKSRERAAGLHSDQEWSVFEWIAYAVACCPDEHLAAKFDVLIREDLDKIQAVANPGRWPRDSDIVRAIGARRDRTSMDEHGLLAALKRQHSASGDFLRAYDMQVGYLAGKPIADGVLFPEIFRLSDETLASIAVAVTGDESITARHIGEVR